MIDHLPPSVEMALSFDVICERNRRSFDAEQDENFFMFFYHPSRNTMPGQVETDRNRQSEYYMYQGQGG